MTRDVFYMLPEASTVKTLQIVKKHVLYTFVLYTFSNRNFDELQNLPTIVKLSLPTTYTYYK